MPCRALANDRQYLLHDQGPKAETRFVKQQYAGRRHQRAADREYLLLAPEGTRQLLASFHAIVETASKPFPPSLHLGAITADKGTKREVFMHRQFRPGSPFLRAMCVPRRTMMSDVALQSMRHRSNIRLSLRRSGPTTREVRALAGAVGAIRPTTSPGRPLD